MNLRTLNPYVASALGDWRKPAANLAPAVPRGAISVTEQSSQCYLLWSSAFSTGASCHSFHAVHTLTLVCFGVLTTPKGTFASEVTR